MDFASAIRLFSRIVLTLSAFVVLAPAQGQIVTETVLHSFSGSPEGSAPTTATLVQGTDGSFYGTTDGGGVDDLGTVFKITASGTLTTLHSFSGSDGSYPQAGLVQGSDGNFYGTTYGGGSAGDGTIFRITSDGTLTTLYSFVESVSGVGQWPTAGLVQGSDGNFYGTTGWGGNAIAGQPDGAGTVFKITPGGTLTTLYSFSGTDGDFPNAGLVQGSDGSFYGTTNEGGSANDGTVYKITPRGALTTLYSFSGTDGEYPSFGSLVLASDGSLYGTTRGAQCCGTGSFVGATVFKITASGMLTTLYSFSSTNDVIPGGLAQGKDGNFYGTTYQGGAYSDGTAFKITTDGTLTTLVSFNGTDGTNPDSSLVLAGDGNFYGTSRYGGTSKEGTVYVLCQSQRPCGRRRPD
jgi:uncharacterized repeat protein (TIGR03803 family)